VSIQNAKSFKNEDDKYYVWRTNIWEYAYVNNFLCPEKVFYKNDDKNGIKIPLENSQEVKIAFKDLGIENQHVSGTVFTLSKYQEYLAKNKQTDLTKKEKQIETEEIFTYVEQMPQFPGGDKEMNKWLSDNLKYPTKAKEQGIQGTVVLRFVIRHNGSISDVKVQRSLEPSCDKEAIRLIESMPQWIPGKQNGNTVNVSYTLSVRFR